MAILKCKMCGGDLSVTEGMKIVECDFCGTTQTVPNADDEKKTNLLTEQTDCVLQASLTVRQASMKVSLLSSPRKRKLTGGCASANMVSNM